MSKSDSTLVRFPDAAPVRRERDPRIDAFRGFALIMILIDHMPGNPYEAGTLRNFGFSDAAEAFFLMSGIAAGIAYSGRFEQWTNGSGRLWSAVSPLWTRAWTLYLVQIFMTVFALAAFAWATTAFRHEEFREMHNLGLIYEETGGALTGLLILTYQIGYVNILPTYIILLLIAPAVIAAGSRWPWIVTAGAFTLWFFASLYRWNMPNWPGGGGWFFSPFAWQCIFVVGLVVGIRHRAGRRLVPFNWVLLGLASAFLLFVLAWKWIPGMGPEMNHRMWQLGQLGVPANLVGHSKAYLGLPRLLHILALAYVLSCIPWVRTAAASAVASPLRLLGRHGLLVFAAGTLLALSCQIAMDVFPDQVWLTWSLPPLALAVSFLVAWLRDQSRTASLPPRNKGRGMPPAEQNPASYQAENASA